jgi:hypothetical protein
MSRLLSSAGCVVCWYETCEWLVIPAKEVRCYALHSEQDDCGFEQYHSDLDPGLATKPWALFPETACGSALGLAKPIDCVLGNASAANWTSVVEITLPLSLVEVTDAWSWSTLPPPPPSIYDAVPRKPRDSFTSCLETVVYERACMHTWLSCVISCGYIRTMHCLEQRATRYQGCCNFYTPPGLFSRGIAIIYCLTLLVCVLVSHFAALVTLWLVLTVSRQSLLIECERMTGGNTYCRIKLQWMHYLCAHKSLAQPTSRCILFDGENISFDASLVIYITFLLFSYPDWGFSVLFPQL